MTDSIHAPAITAFKTLTGLGDAVYAAPIIQHFAHLGPVYVSTKYPEVFQHITGFVQAAEETRFSGPTLRYSRAPGAHQYGDMCKIAGVPMLPFSLPWRVDLGFMRLWEEVEARAQGRKVCLIKEPSTAHLHRARNDFSFSPSPMVMQKWMLDHRNFFFVSVEHDTNTIRQRLVGIDYKFQALSVSEYVSLFSLVDHVASQIGHPCPLAQAFSKPLTVFLPEKPLLGIFKNLSPESVLVPREFAPASVEVI